MRFQTTLTLLLPALALAAAPLAPVGVGVGDPLPEVSLEGFAQTRAESFEDLAGRAVLFEFFAYWWGPCAGQVEHLNQLQEQFGDKGLTVVGVTGESASSTEPWIEKHGAKYAYAYDKTLGLMRATGQSGLPSSVLVDASGTILYVGHPASINASLIERAVQGALTKPIYDWPKELSGVAKAIRKGNLGDAVTEVQKLGDAHADIAAAVQNMVKARVSAVERARDDKDWLRVVTLGEPLVKGLGKLPEAAQVEAILDALDGDKEAKAVLKAQQKVAKYFAGDIKKNQFDRVQKDLEKIAEEFSGTAAARDARDGLEKLRAMRKE